MAVLIENQEELLFRQVNPAWIRDGRPTSQAFRPTPKDKNQLSVACSTLTTAEGAFVLHTGAKQLKSAGTWAVTVAECESHTLRCFYDPTTNPPEPVADPAHGYIDYSTLPTRSAADAVGALIARVAVSRGCLFPVSANGEN